MTTATKNIILLSISCFTFISICRISEAQDKPQHNKRVVCYYSHWATYRKPYPFTPNEIDPALCTHIIYLYAGIKSDTQDAIISSSPYSDLKKDYGLGYYEKVTSLKTRYPHLKVLLCVGSWNVGSINFSKLSQSTSKRKSFISSVVAYLREHNFDGLDVFWMFPAERGGIPEDKDNFTKLLRELKEEFEKHNYLLTVYLSERRSTIDNGYDLPSIGCTVDWVNLFGHDYNSPWNKKFGINSPLDSNDDKNVKKVVDYYLDHGIPSSKLVLILPTFGFGYINTHEPGNADGLSGFYDEDKGFLTFIEICTNVSDPKSGWSETWDSVSSTPVAVKGNNKISYDNQKSIKLKVKFAYEKNLLGVGVRGLDTDDFLGLCSLPGYGNKENESKFPLVKAINQEFELLSQGEYKQSPDNSPDTSDINISVVIEKY